MCSTDSDDDFWADTVFKTVEVFKFDVGQERYAVGEEFHAFSPGISNSCGAWTDFGEEYLVDFYRQGDGDGDPLYTVLSCGIYRRWSYLSEDDEESLRSCTCDGGCDIFQVTAKVGWNCCVAGDEVRCMCTVLTKREEQV